MSTPETATPAPTPAEDAVQAPPAGAESGTQPPAENSAVAGADTAVAETAPAAVDAEAAVAAEEKPVAAEATPDASAAAPAPAADGQPESTAAQAAATDATAPPSAAPDAAAKPAGVAGPRPNRKPQDKTGKGGKPARPRPPRPPSPPSGPSALDKALEPVVEAVRAAMVASQLVDGKVFGWNKGGFHVSLGGVPAFCPSSQIEAGPAQDPATYVDQTLAFRVLREEKEGRRFVVSRSLAQNVEKSAQATATRANLTAGAVVDGTVTSLTTFGAFIDLGGIEGLVHVSEISRKRVEKPADALTVGQQVKVKILKVDLKRVSLSIKELEPDPWSELAATLTVGGPFSGTIARKSPFGLFVELAPGLEGLVHVSQLPLGQTLEHPALAPGQTVNGFVREIDPEKRRLALALREVAIGDPWQGIEKRYHEGQVIETTVEKATPTGVVLALEPGLTGVLPAAEMKMPKGNDPRRMFAPGKKVKVQIASIETKRRRINLALEGAKVEGSKADYQAYVKKSTQGDRGLGALAAALSRIK